MRKCHVIPLKLSISIVINETPFKLETVALPVYAHQRTEGGL
jgi:predicted membrane chloride channel (bestrophin family)